MTTDTTNKVIDHVEVRKAENGYFLIVFYSNNLSELPDTKDEDELNHWQMKQEYMMHNNRPKTYVFSDYDSLSQFVKINAGWD